ncbi:MAG: LysM peptidoglycan-binding domain-containing protein, partial [Sinobacteraceae bacterium]|nr:LysM peptidoglycan-binding domain-containing protein [Nevskiaceae bacterium]
MHKFNRFATAFRGLAGFRGWLVVLMAGLAMVACAHHPDRSVPASTASASDSTLKTHPLTAVADVVKARQVEPELGLRQHAPLHYVVKKGDTLWDIASYYLEDPWKWPVLWYDNPQIHNPHLIYPGDVLELVWVKGHPRLTF